METQVEFSVGDVTLEGLLSSTQADTGIAVCHPHPLRGGNMHNNVVSALVGGLQGAGFLTLRFNFRGVGGSSGTHDDGNRERNDVGAAVSFLIEQANCSKVALVGYSFGALVALQAGADDARVQSMVGVGLPVASRDAAFVRGIAKPTLLISGDRDDFSPISTLIDVAEPDPGPVSVATVQSADHFFYGTEDSLAAKVAEFLLNGGTATAG